MVEFSEIVPVKKIEKEGPDIKTIYLDYEAEFSPGQFYMLWLPGADEKPFVFSKNGKMSAITVRMKGPFTKKMFTLKPGDIIGVRGPYGKGFNLEKIRRACIVAGGIGAAPTITLAEGLKKKRARVEIILGAKKGEELLFEKRFKRTGELYITTDDGSKGRKCSCTDVLDELLKKKKFDAVYGCGPELMLEKVFRICEKRKANCQLSLERYMRCGFGVCGQCIIDGWLVCKDGPVFDSKQLRKLKEFGKFAYLKSGRKVSLQEYFSWRQG